MKLLSLTIMLCGFMIGFLSDASAAIVEKNTASTELAPCSRLGLPDGSMDPLSLTIYYARQTIDLKIKLEADLNADELSRIMNECHTVALKVSAKNKILTLDSDSSVFTYKAAFMSCLEAKGGLEEINVEISIGNTCHW